MSADDVRRMTVFEGNVILNKGTIAVRAERIVVRQDAEGFQYTTATGAPVRFKQRMDPKEGEKEGRYVTTVLDALHAGDWTALDRRSRSSESARRAA